MKAADGSVRPFLFQVEEMIVLADEKLAKENEAIEESDDEFMKKFSDDPENGTAEKEKEHESFPSKLSRLYWGKNRHNPLTKPLRKWVLLFLGPVTAAFIIGFVWPFIQGIYLSMCKFQLIQDAEFVGFKNYISAFNDAGFLRSFWYTALFAIVSLVLINVLAFAVAYVLTLGIKGSNLFRTVFFMPNLIGGIVLGYIWSMIFDGIFSALDMPSIVQNSTWGFWGLIILMCWQQIGYMMIIYVAGLNAIPEDMLEAAKIDGATRWQTLYKVTIPNMMPSITICTFLSLTNGFKLFDQNLALTNGQTILLENGVGIKQTEMLALNIYSTFYGTNTSARGTAQAKAVIFFILVAAIGLAQLAYTRKKEVQQ